MKRKGSRGITLIELVAILVVAGVAIPVLLSMWATVSWQSVRSETIGDASFYAQGLLEQIRAKRFDENEGSVWSSLLGPDAGENSADASTFDDADDFVGSTDANITAPAAGFTREVNAAYVFLDADNAWQPCSAPVTCTAVTDCSTCNQCCFKQITVSVRKPGTDAGDISMTTLVAGF